MSLTQDYPTGWQRRTAEVLDGWDTNGVPTKTLATSIADGLKLVTTAGTRETLVASTTSCKQVSITAKVTNTGTVVIGGATVIAASGATRRGIPLNSGDSVTIPIDDLAKLYVDVTVSGEGVTYAYIA